MISLPRGQKICNIIERIKQIGYRKKSIAMEGNLNLNKSEATRKMHFEREREQGIFEVGTLEEVAIGI
jgi:hypothetical protein